LSVCRLQKSASAPLVAPPPPTAVVAGSRITHPPASPRRTAGAATGAPLPPQAHDQPAVNRSCPSRRSHPCAICPPPISRSGATHCACPPRATRSSCICFAPGRAARGKTGQSPLHTCDGALRSHKAHPALTFQPRCPRSFTATLSPISTRFPAQVPRDAVPPHRFAAPRWLNKCAFGQRDAPPPSKSRTNCARPAKSEHPIPAGKAAPPERPVCRSENCARHALVSARPLPASVLAEQGTSSARVTTTAPHRASPIAAKPRAGKNVSQDQIGFVTAERQLLGPCKTAAQSFHMLAAFCAATAHPQQKLTTARSCARLASSTPSCAMKSSVRASFGQVLTAAISQMPQSPPIDRPRLFLFGTVRFMPVNAPAPTPSSHGPHMADHDTHTDGSWGRAIVTSAARYQCNSGIATRADIQPQFPWMTARDDRHAPAGSRSLRAFRERDHRPPRAYASKVLLVATIRHVHRQRTGHDACTPIHTSTDAASFCARTCDFRQGLATTLATRHPLTADTMGRAGTVQSASSRRGTVTRSAKSPAVIKRRCWQPSHRFGLAPAMTPACGPPNSLSTRNANRSTPLSKYPPTPVHSRKPERRSVNQLAAARDLHQDKGRSAAICAKPCVTGQSRYNPYKREKFWYGFSTRTAVSSSIRVRHNRYSRVLCVARLLCSGLSPL